MSKITLDQAKIDMYINFKDRVRKELERLGLSHLAN